MTHKIPSIFRISFSTIKPVYNKLDNSNINDGNLFYEVLQVFADSPLDCPMYFM